MCGKETEELFLAEVEGTRLKVCKECAKFGHVIKRISGINKDTKEKGNKGYAGRREQRTVIAEKQTETIEAISSDYANRIKKAREKLGLTQKDFAGKINEKRSVIHNLEAGHFEPNLELAKKLEHALKIKLIEEYEEKAVDIKKEKTGGLTIGDLVK